MFSGHCRAPAPRSRSSWLQVGYGGVHGHAGRSVNAPLAESVFAVCTAVGAAQPAELERCAPLLPRYGSAVRIGHTDGAEVAAGVARSDERTRLAAVLSPCPDDRPRALDRRSFLA